MHFAPPLSETTCLSAGVEVWCLSAGDEVERVQLYALGLVSAYRGTSNENYQCCE